MLSNLDDIDQRLLDTLQHDGRITNAELAERVGLSPSACLRRVQQLEAAGYIGSYHALLDAERLGLGMRVFLQVKMQQNDAHSLARFDEHLRMLPEVVAAYRVTGDSDYLVHVVTRDLQAFRDFMMQRLLADGHVFNTSSSVAIDTIKQTTMLPLRLPEPR